MHNSKIEHYRTNSPYMNYIRKTNNTDIDYNPLCGSVTTLKQWKCKPYNTEEFRVNYDHPICKKTYQFFLKVDRLKKQALTNITGRKKVIDFNVLSDSDRSLINTEMKIVVNGGN